MSLDFFLGMFPKLLHGTWITLVILLLSGLIGNALAVGVALARVSKNPIVNSTSYFYTLLMRGTPLLVQIYLLYYGLRQYLLPFARRTAELPLALSAGRVLVRRRRPQPQYRGLFGRGSSRRDPGRPPWGDRGGPRLRHVQMAHAAARHLCPAPSESCLPTLVGETILLLKSTPLVSTITVLDMMGTANYIRVQTFRVYEPLLSAALIYVFLTFVLTRIFRWVERRLNRDRIEPVQLAAGIANPDLQPNL